jgi:hypothetical protein
MSKSDLLRTSARWMTNELRYYSDRVDSLEGEDERRRPHTIVHIAKLRVEFETGAVWAVIAMLEWAAEASRAAHVNAPPPPPPEQRSLAIADEHREAQRGPRDGEDG